jgi:2-succinyl-6-hydroxy-2,4-cyclohexadiene-1-carboxylate synthase
VAQNVAAAVTGTAHSLADMAPAGEAPAAIHVERRGAGPRLVLVHGFTQTGRSWAAIAADLAVDHEVVTVDAPGHGASAPAVGGLADGAEALVDAAGPGVYIGYSMGARYVLRAALARPDAIRAAVLLGANPGIEDAAERSARRASDEALAAAVEADGVDAFLERWLAQPLFASLPSSAADVADRRRNTAAGLASSLRVAGTGAEPDVWTDLGRIGQPLLVLAGADDAKFVAIGRRLAAAVGANARFETVAAAGHAAHLEQPAAFVAIVRAWLGGT